MTSTAARWLAVAAVMWLAVSSDSSRAQDSFPTPGLPSADDYWRFAEARDTAKAYRWFLLYYPKDPRAATADARWTAREAEEARTEGTRAARRRFERRHPGIPLHGRLPAGMGAPRPSAGGGAVGSDAGSPIARRAVEVLLGELEDPHSWEREYAAEALAKLGDARALEALLGALKDPDSSWLVRQSAAEALGKLGDARAVEALLGALKDTDASVRRSAARALGKLGDPRAVDALLGALKDRDYDMRRAAAEALGNLDDPRAVEPLLGALKDPDWRVPSSAAKALGELGDAHALEGLLGALKDTEYAVRKCAAEALGKMGDARAVEALLVVALKDPDWRVPWSASEALGNLDDPRAVEPLLEALKDPNPYVRGRAAPALGKVGDARAVEALLGALKDTEGPVRASAAGALGKSGDARAVEGLLGALKDPEPKVRWYAAQALGELGDARSLEALLGALRDPASDPGVRQSAAEALGELGDARVVEALLEALKDNYSTVQQSAAEALGKCGDPWAVDALLSALQERKLGAEHATPSLATLAVRHGPGRLRESLRSNDSYVRRVAADALALVADRRRELLFGEVRPKDGGPPTEKKESEPARRSILDQVRSAGSRVGTGDLQAVAKLKEGLKSADTEVQLAAIAGLVQTREKNPAAVEDLKKALTETRNETVKLKLTGELAKLGDEEALKGIRGLVKSEDPVERGYAAAVLGEAKPGEVAEELVKALDDPAPLVRVHAAAAILRTLQAQTAEAGASSPPAPAGGEKKEER